MTMQRVPSHEEPDQGVMINKNNIIDALIIRTLKSSKSMENNSLVKTILTNDIMKKFFGGNIDTNLIIKRMEVLLDKNLCKRKVDGKLVVWEY